MQINGTRINADLSDILSELQRQLNMNGIQLLGKMRDTPGNIMVCCPYHKNGQERKPSAGIDKSTGVFHCFSCGEIHTLPEMISYCFGKDDILGNFGWNWVLKNFVTIAIEDRRPLKLDMSRDKEPEKKVYVSESELDSYRTYHPYMWRRKMTPEIVDIFDIGYDAKTGCITFPIRDEKGNTLFIARRSVTTKFFNYPAGAEKPVYGLYELSQLAEYPKEVYICESMIDALTIWAYGKYAVALNGLGNELQFKQLKLMPCRTFILATDSDIAGMTARKRIRSIITNKIVKEIIFPPNRKDINDLSKEEFDNITEVF